MDSRMYYIIILLLVYLWLGFTTVIQTYEKIEMAKMQQKESKNG